MAWRADCPTRDLVCSPSSLFKVGAIFLILIVSLIQRAYMSVCLSIHHVHLSQSITYLYTPARSVIADLL